MWETDPLVAVTVTVYVPAVGELHERVVVVEEGRVMLVGLVLQEMPEGAETENVTVPEKPFCALRLIVEVAETPVLTADAEDAVREKSGVELEVETNTAIDRL